MRYEGDPRAGRRHAAGAEALDTETIGRERGKYLVGAVLFLSLMIGGGTASGLLTDAVVQLAAIGLLGFALASPREASAGAAERVLLVACAAAVIVQLVPLPYAFVQDLRPEWLREVMQTARPEWPYGFVTLDVTRTVEVLLYFTSCALMFLAVCRLRPEQVFALLPFFFIGVACNAIAAGLQNSLQRDVRIEGLLSYAIDTGLFANENHFSALLYVSIPFIVYYAVYEGRFRTALVLLALNLLVLLAVGSRAGVLIGLAITVLSFVVLALRSRVNVALAMAITAVLGVYAFGALSKIDVNELDPEYGRGEFAERSVEAIRENWAGTGYGTFPEVYQYYEREAMIFRTYVNHVHNDYLEVVLEGGVTAAVLIIAYFLLLLRRMFFQDALRPIQKAAMLSIIFLLVHSLVDYPLRTMALAMVFAMLNALLFHRGLLRHGLVEKPAVSVRHDGRTVTVPLEPG